MNWRDLIKNVFATEKRQRDKYLGRIRKAERASPFEIKGMGKREGKRETRTNTPRIMGRLHLQK